MTRAYDDVDGDEEDEDEVALLDRSTGFVEVLLDDDDEKDMLGEITISFINKGWAGIEEEGVES